MKTQMCIYIDSDLKDTINKLYPSQISSKINDYLRRLVAFSKNDIHKIDKIKLVREQDEIEGKISQLDIKLKFIVERIQQIDDIQKIEESKRLEKEEETARVKTTCAVCGIPRPNEKMHTFPGGLVCKSCFNPLNKDKIRQLSLRGDEVEPIRDISVHGRKQRKVAVKKRDHGEDEPRHKRRIV